MTIAHRMLALLMLSWQILFAQTSPTLSLEQCYTRAAQNYPLIKQKDLISLSATYTTENAAKGYYPQITLNGQATYQSDVTALKINIPGFPAPQALSKDQYKIYAEIGQVIYDGGIIRQQQKTTALNSAVEQQKIEVELYQLRSRVNQIFFGALLIDEQLLQLNLTRKDLQSAIDKMGAAIANGVALPSGKDVLTAEILKLQQKEIELRAARKAFVDMMGLFLQEELPESTVFEKPALAASSVQSIHRPELELFTTQQNLVQSQYSLLNARNLPKASFFLQAGYGKPGLNLLKNEFAFYYLGGIRLNWSLSGFYTRKNERMNIDVSLKNIDVQRELFLFNTNLSLRQQNEETAKMDRLMELDQQIIALRTKVKDTAKIQLSNGAITANDYLRELNAEDLARQNLILHQTQLLQAQYSIKTTTGN